MSVFLNFTIYNDSPEPWAIGFQDGVSPGFTGIVELHDNIFFYLVVIAILVFWMLGSTIYYFNYDKTKIVHKYLVHGTLIEILWTIFPAIVLLAIAIPSFRLLYILDEVTLPTITVKVTGFLTDGPRSYFINKIKNTKSASIFVFNYISSPWSCRAKEDKSVLLCKENFKTYNDYLVKKILYLNIFTSPLSSTGKVTPDISSNSALYSCKAIRELIIYYSVLNGWLISSSHKHLRPLLKLEAEGAEGERCTTIDRYLRSSSAPETQILNRKHTTLWATRKEKNNRLSYLNFALCKAKGTRYLSVGPFPLKSKGPFIRAFNTRCRAINRVGPHNLDLISVIFGLLLGDGYANNRTGEGVRIAIKQSGIHKEYLFFLYHFFLDRGYCSNLEPRKYTRTIQGINKIYLGYEFNTYTFRSFLWIYKSFYKNGKKIIPYNLEKYMNSISLSIWIMDDGGWTGEGVRISANSFTYDELIFIQNILNKNFNLDSTIQKISIKNRYSIYIKKNSIDKLRSITIPYFHKSMLYKLGI